MDSETKIYCNETTKYSESNQNQNESLWIEIESNLGNLIGYPTM